MLKCAFYEKEITPPLECEMTGYFNPRPAMDVLDRLYVKAVVFENNGESVAMIVADACGLSRALCNKITSRVERMTGIPSDNIMVIATHSHQSIPIGSGVASADEIYLDVFCRIAADCVTLAQKRLVPAKIKYAKGRVEGISFVRNFRMKDGTIKTNPGRNNPDIVEPYDVPDYDFPLLMVYDENDKPMGSVTNFACHLDCIGSPSQLSGDYASILSYELKKEFGNDFVSFFAMGTAGNINHINPLDSTPIEKNHYVGMGRRLADEVRKILSDLVEIKDVKLSSVKNVVKLTKRTISDEELEKEKEMASRKEVIAATSTDRSLGVCYRGYIANNIVYAASNKSKTEDFILQVITIGDIKIYGLSAEIYVNFGRSIKQNAPTDKVFIMTKANANCGYIPTEELFSEKKLYEVRISSAPFSADTGDMLVEKLKEIQ